MVARKPQDTGTPFNRRDFLKVAGATAVATAFGLPLRGGQNPPLKIYLATSERYCRKFFALRLRPALAETGMDVFFPALGRANLYANPRRTLRTLRTLLGQGEVDFAVVPEGLMPALVAAFGEQLVDLAAEADRLREARIEFLPTGDSIFAFNLLGGAVMVGLSARAREAMPQVIAALAAALRHRVFVQASGPHLADGADAAQVDVEVFDAHDRPVDGRIFLALAIGKDEKILYPAESLGDGAYRARIPCMLAGTGHLVVVDESSRVLDPVGGATEVTFLPGPLTHWLSTPVRPLADADNKDRATFRLRGFDDLGNPVPRTAAGVEVRAAGARATVEEDGTGGLTVALSSSRFGRVEAQVVDRATGAAEPLVASFPRLRFGDGEKYVVEIPADAAAGPEPLVGIPLIAYAPPTAPLTGYDVSITFDPAGCGVEQVVPAADLATAEFTTSVAGGHLTIHHRFAPQAGRVELATVTMRALEEGTGTESIDTGSSQLQTLAGPVALTADVVANAEKEQKKIEKTVKLKIKIVMGTGGASLGTDAEAMDKLCKAVDKVNKIFCPAKIKFEKEISTIKCDLGANGLDEYKKSGTMTGEEMTLIDKCKPAKGEIVAFVVGKLSCGSLGESFGKTQFPDDAKKGRTGTVALDDDKVLDSTTFAHELGHILLDQAAHPAKTDFPTCKDYEKNLMHPTNPDPECLTADQIKKMKDNTCAAQGMGGTPGTGF